jgi:membrane associated rhomboid family serine protease
MPTSLFALLLLSGAALYFMTPEERTRLLRSAVALAKQGAGAVAQSATSSDPFDEFLRARTGWPIVTPLIAAACAFVFIAMAFDGTTASGTERLIAWGANFAPRTSNGEWWRLLTSMFVHSGFVHLVAMLVGLIPVGLILERAVGRIAFACVYLSAGLVASVISLWTASAMSIGVGASGAVCGVYGLLVATVLWAVVGRLKVSVPLMTVVQLGVAALLFLLSTLMTDHLGARSELAGLGVGLAGGFVIARGIASGKPAVKRPLALAAAAALIAIAGVMPLQGIVDARPEIVRVAAFEERTAAAYDVAVDKFKRGRLTPEALSQVIDRGILPDLQTMRGRLKALRGVPREQAPMVEAANEYIKLREESWRRRSEALHKRNMKLLHDAEQSERAALDAFQKLRAS